MAGRRSGRIPAESMKHDDGTGMVLTTTWRESITETSLPPSDMRKNEKVRAQRAAKRKGQHTADY